MTNNELLDKMAAHFDQRQADVLARAKAIEKAMPETAAKLRSQAIAFNEAAAYAIQQKGA